MQRRIVGFDVVDAARVLVGRGRRRVKVATIRRMLAFKNPAVYEDFPQASLREVVATLFPLYKNRRSRTKWFKVSATQLEWLEGHLGGNLRKAKYVQESEYGLDPVGDQAVDEVRQA